MSSEKKYGLVKNGIVHSVFYSEKSKSEYPDIEPYLMEIPEEVQCNWVYDGENFIDPNLFFENQQAIKPWYKFW